MCNSIFEVSMRRLALIALLAGSATTPLAAQSRGLPPALLEDTRLDLMGTEAAWVGEVRKGVVEAYESAVRHADLFNQLLRAGDLARAAFVWGSILGLSDDRDALLAWLYPAMSG